MDLALSFFKNFAHSAVTIPWKQCPVEWPSGDLNFDFEQRNDMVRPMFQEGNFNLCLRYSL